MERDVEIPPFSGAFSIDMGIVKERGRSRDGMIAGGNV